MTLRRLIIVGLAVFGLLSVLRAVSRRRATIVVEETPASNGTGGVPADVASAVSMPA